MNENVIIITDGKEHEVWGGLSELCREHGISHNYLKTKKYPFTYRGILFKRVVFRSKNGLVFPMKKSNIKFEDENK